MGGHPPKSLGVGGHEPAIDTGTMNRHASPMVGPVQGHSDGGRTQRALVFDAESLDRLFRSTACSIALARHLTVKPMRSDERDSVGVKAIIAIMPDAYLPQEVEVPNDAVIDTETAEGTNEFGAAFWQQLDSRGARGAVAFLNDVEAQRENALAKVHDTFRQVSRHNAGALDTSEKIKATLGGIKCASTIVVAGIALPVAAGGSLATFGIGTAYSVGLTLVKNWASAPSADLVLISTKKAAEKAGQKAVKGVSKSLQGAYASEAQNLQQAERRIEWLSKRVDKTARPRDVGRLARAKDAAGAARGAGKWATALGSVPYLFFAWSVYDAGRTLRDDLGP